MYQAGESDDAHLRELPIALMAVCAAENAFEFRAHPGLAAWLKPEHREYMQELLADLSQRIELTPEAFQQLSALSVGPLITRDTGDDLTARPDLLAEWNELIPLARSV